MGSFPKLGFVETRERQTDRKCIAGKTVYLLLDDIDGHDISSDTVGWFAAYPYAILERGPFQDKNCRVGYDG